MFVFRNLFKYDRLSIPFSMENNLTSTIENFQTIPKLSMNDNVIRSLSGEIRQSQGLII